jgi:hypothetical protein
MRSYADTPHKPSPCVDYDIAGHRSLCRPTVSLACVVDIDSTEGEPGRVLRVPSKDTRTPRTAVAAEVPIWPVSYPDWSGRCYRPRGRQDYSVAR